MEARALVGEFLNIPLDMDDTMMNIMYLASKAIGIRNRKQGT